VENKFEPAKPFMLWRNYSEVGDAEAEGLGAGAGALERVEGATGAPLPAVSDPSPILFKETASIFPVGFTPFLS
jgi:hypothetical protein